MVFLVNMNPYEGDIWFSKVFEDDILLNSLNLLLCTFPQLLQWLIHYRKQLLWNNLIYILNSLDCLNEDGAVTTIYFLLFNILGNQSVLVGFTFLAYQILKFKRIPFTFRWGWWPNHMFSWVSKFWSKKANSLASKHLCKAFI
jgi:hypothetical protein